MCGNLTDQVRSIAKATVRSAALLPELAQAHYETEQLQTAVARGDLSQKVTIEANGEVLQLVVTINSMVDRVSL